MVVFLKIDRIPYFDIRHSTFDICHLSFVMLDRCTQPGIWPCPKTQMIWLMIACIFFFGKVPLFSLSRLLSITIIWVHRARLAAGKFASPFWSKTLPGIPACLVCLVSGMTTTVWNLLRLIESRCTMTTGLVTFGSDPFERWRFAQKTSPWQTTIYPPFHGQHRPQAFPQPSHCPRLYLPGCRMPYCITL